ncbi:MAG: hypothetical protein PHG35_01940 [Dehalococcoidales bacterium]|nr:hypothetical protein [Dehalococcoidales bacterium]
MKWIEKHLNWTYGIALIVSLIFAIWAILGNLIALIIFLVIVYTGAEIIAWRKGNWAIHRFPTGIPLILCPPLVAIITLCSHNNRKKELVENITTADNERNSF